MRLADEGACDQLDLLRQVLDRADEADPRRHRLLDRARERDGPEGLGMQWVTWHGVERPCGHQLDAVDLEDGGQAVDPAPQPLVLGAILV